ncbi:MAG TPA: ABC transporter ATP-binding protein [Myxococcota bacterium]|nr:ABC transporter ATP-binding protein [Myxococcota bacterium]
MSPPAVHALVRLEEVHRSYLMGSATVEALRGVSLRVDRGEYLAVIGPSGSGKSTLMHIAGCLDRPTSGRCWLDGTPVENLPDDELSRLRNGRIGFVFQSFFLIPQLSVQENVEVPLVYAGVERGERAGRARAVLERVGLGRRLEHRPNELSGGECQRVAIARALVTGPELVLADEPTGNLDRRTGDEITGLLEGLHAEGVSVVVVTHDPAKARRADRIVQMEDGLIERELRGSERARLGDALEAAAR